MRGWTGRGGGRTPPPHTPGRRGAAGARVAGLCVLGAALALPLLLWPADRPPPAREPPFTLAHPFVPADSPSVLLYVSPRCRWCLAELEGWAEELGGWEGRGPLVVLAPDADPVQGGEGLPPSLRRRWRHDADGALGQALRVRAVPLRAHVTAGGRVVSVGVGLSSEAERRRLLAVLNPSLPLPEEPR